MGKLFSIAFIFSLAHMCSWGQATFEIVPMGMFAHQTTVTENIAKVELGTISFDQKLQPIEFGLINRSQEPLWFERVYSAEPMCGPDWPRDTAQPGDTLFWSYFCDTRTARGFFRKQSTLKTNQGIGQVQFNGEVLPIDIQTENLIKVTPNPDHPDLLSGEFTFQNNSDSPISISYLTNFQHLKIISSLNSQAVTIFRDSETKITFKVSASALSQNNHFQLSLKQGEKTWLVDYCLHLP